jgi:hypothetical protein
LPARVSCLPSARPLVAVPSGAMVVSVAALMFMRYTYTFLCVNQTRDHAQTWAATTHNPGVPCG